MVDKNIEKEEPLFSIMGITSHTRLLPTGTFLDVYEVKFITRSGIVSQIDVSKIDFDREKTRQAVKEEAEKLEDVMSL